MIWKFLRIFGFSFFKNWTPINFHNIWNILKSSLFCSIHHKNAHSSFNINWILIRRLTVKLTRFKVWKKYFTAIKSLSYALYHYCVILGELAECCTKFPLRRCWIYFCMNLLIYFILFYFISFTQWLVAVFFREWSNF